jgi:transcriptional regulator with XRE-family HTH domain
MSEQIQERIKQEIIAKMRAKGMNPRKLAKLLGVQPPTLYRWFKGESTPHTATALLACYVLGIDVEWHRQSLPDELANHIPPPSNQGTVKNGVVWLGN